MLLSKEGAATYFKRQYTIEPIFGHFKYNLLYRSFVLRGLAKVNAEFQVYVHWVESAKDVKIRAKSSADVKIKVLEKQYQRL